MFQLIKKDLLLTKKSLPFMAVMMLFFAVTLAGAGDAGLMISTMALCYILVYDAGLREDKTDSNKLLVCLPISRSAIVLSKYMSVYLYAALILIGNGLIRLFAEMLQVGHLTIPFTLKGTFGALAALTVIFSIFYPLIFKLGFVKSRIINMLVLFVIVFAGTGLLNLVARKTGVHLLHVQPDLAVTIALVAGVLAVLAGSCLVSLSFFRKREF